MMAFEGLLDLSYTPTGANAHSEQLPEETTGTGQTARRIAKAVATAATVIAMSFVLGTGGVSQRPVVSLSPYASGTGGQVRIHTRRQRASNQEPRANGNVVATTDRLNEVRNRLSLNMKQLATAMQVGRPALYRWFDGASPHESNLQRLKLLYDIATEWTQLSQEPVGKNLIIPIGGKESLASMLSASTLDLPRIRTAMRTIADAMKARNDRRERSGYRSAASIIAERGYRQDSAEAQRRRIEDASDA